MKNIFLAAAILFLVHTSLLAQVPATWTAARVQTTLKLDTIIHAINTRWNGAPYCTAFSGNVLLANSNRGYNLFTPNPPGGPDSTYERNLLLRIDTVLLAYKALGYKAVDITINYPMLVDSFPHHKEYLHFYERVYQTARLRGFKIIEGCQATFADSLFGEPYFVQDVLNYLYQPNGTPDTLDRNRYLLDKGRMMQTIIDSLRPDYLTVETEPGTQQANLFNLISFAPDSVDEYVNFFAHHLARHNTLLGAGSGTWDSLDYIQRYVHDSIDYIDYHVYPPNKNFIADKAFIIDSIAHNNGKGIVIGEAWCNKETDSEYYSLSPLQSASLNQSRDVFDFFEPVDTQFVRAMVNLSQQGRIDVVSFFYSNVMYGQIPYTAAFDTIPAERQFRIGEAAEFNNMGRSMTGPVGTFTEGAISNVCGATSSCDTVSGLSAVPDYGSSTYNVIVSWNAVAGSLGYQYTIDGSPLVPSGPGTYTGSTSDTFSLSPGTTYYLHVLDSCANGNSAWVTIPFTTFNTGVASVQGSSDVGLVAYPNPATDILTLKINAGSNGQVQLMDMNGKILQTTICYNNTVGLDLAGIPSGLYLIRYMDSTHAATVMITKQ